MQLFAFLAKYLFFILPDIIFCFALIFRIKFVASNEIGKISKQFGEIGPTPIKNLP